MSASCPQQKFHSSSRFPSLFLRGLGSFLILFLQAKLGECVSLWFVLTPPPLNWLTEQKNPFEVCKHAAWCNEFGYNLYCANINWAFSLTWPAAMQIYCNKRKRLHKKRVQLPQDWIGTQTWPAFYCFGTPTWPPWRHVKTLYPRKEIFICALHWLNKILKS